MAQVDEEYLAGIIQAAIERNDTDFAADAFASVSQERYDDMLEGISFGTWFDDALLRANAAIVDELKSTLAGISQNEAEKLEDDDTALFDNLAASIDVYYADELSDALDDDPSEVVEDVQDWLSETYGVRQEDLPNTLSELKVVTDQVDNANRIVQKRFMERMADIFSDGWYQAQYGQVLSEFQMGRRTELYDKVVDPDMQIWAGAIENDKLDDFVENQLQLDLAWAANDNAALDFMRQKLYEVLADDMDEDAIERLIVSLGDDLEEYAKVVENPNSVL